MSWMPEYVLVLLFATIMDYFLAIKIESANNPLKRKRYLILSIISNLGLLFVFKYFNFFSESIRTILEIFSLSINIPHSNLILPLGLSFHTFQSLGYMIEVYRGEVKPERNIGIFALYISFFPQLVAGPIERAKNLIPQFYEEHKFDYNKIIQGAKIAIWGFFLKVVVADRLAIPVDYAYNHIETTGGLSLAIATIFFAFQIYGDFAGYTYIAIGTAKMMGFTLIENFRMPYLSKSINEFWRRWHISLSSWFRDYLYIPLGGNKKGLKRTIINLTIVFLLSGLWHGAAWTFVIWGTIHGTLVIINTLIKKIKNKKVKKNESLVKVLLKRLLTFMVVYFGWIFFRADNLSNSLLIIKNIFSWTIPRFVNLNLSLTDLTIAVVLIIFVMVIDYFKEKIFIKEENINWLIKLVYYLLLFWTIIILGSFGGREFIYFQF